MGYAMEYANAESIFEEIRSVTPSYAGITYSRIEHEGIPWPCPSEDHPGTPVLHVGQFSIGRAIFSAIDHRPPAEIPDKDYPFFLTTGRVLQHFHTGTMTRKGNGLNQLYPELLIEINPDDAQSCEITEGDMVIVSSRRGTIKAKAQLSNRPGKGVIFIPFHFHEAAVNRLTNSALDPIAKIPELKVCAVKIQKYL